MANSLGLKPRDLAALGPVPGEEVADKAGERYSAGLEGLMEQKRSTVARRRNRSAETEQVAREISALEAATHVAAPGSEDVGRLKDLRRRFAEWRRAEALEPADDKETLRWPGPCGGVSARTACPVNDLASGIGVS